jgi:hypothetical protein
MGTVKVDRGHNEGTRHIFRTSHCKHTKSNTPFCIFMLPYMNMCHTQTLYPVYSLLWQWNYKIFPNDLQESNHIHVIMRRRESDSVSAEKQLQSLNKTRILDLF